MQAQAIVDDVGVEIASPDGAHEMLSLKGGVRVNFWRYPRKAFVRISKERWEKNCVHSYWQNEITGA